MRHEVTEFLDNLAHPLRMEIEVLRQIILNSNPKLSENIKWNAPNYCYNNEDRITMKIYPPKQIQVIFHRGTKALEPPKERLISDDTKLLTWKTNDRAFATFRTMEEIAANESNFTDILNAWLNSAS